VKQIFIGLDLGQARDYTALAVLDRTERDGPVDRVTWQRRKEVSLEVKFLERLELGTSYPAVVERVDRVVQMLSAEAPVELLVDATGVGRPVVDLLVEANLNCYLRPVLVTPGSGEKETGGYLHIGKVDLITGLQVMLQGEELRLSADLEYAPVLLREMTEMRVKMGDRKEQIGAWREGAHDDLAFALALAAWGARALVPGNMCGRVPLW
jgi:hypothetical protein